jgi:16S rRNA G1207 methylase RsmC
VAVRFLEGARGHLAKGGKIWLLVSSLTSMGRIGKFGGKVIVKRRVFGEDLVVLEFGD